MHVSYSICPVQFPTGEASCGKSGGKSISRFDFGTTRIAEALRGYSTNSAGGVLESGGCAGMDLPESG